MKRVGDQKEVVASAKSDRGDVSDMSVLSLSAVGRCLNSSSTGSRVAREWVNTRRNGCDCGQKVGNGLESDSCDVGAIQLIVISTVAKG